jgi:hypothetical protein
MKSSLFISLCLGLIMSGCSVETCSDPANKLPADSSGSLSSLDGSDSIPAKPMDTRPSDSTLGAMPAQIKDSLPHHPQMRKDSSKNPVGRYDSRLDPHSPNYKKGNITTPYPPGKGEVVPPKK